MQENVEYIEKALLVGVNIANEKDFDISMEELKELAIACDFEVASTIVQNLEKVNKALYVGTGKVKEISDISKELKCDLIIFNNELSPSQLRNLQDYIDIPILDRTGLILEIFAKRAKSKEAKLQVEVAKLKYLLPRLVGMHSGLGRQGGGSGLSNKGSGETKLELDRRKIETRINLLSKELEQVENTKNVQRKKRLTSNEPLVSLAGYTNAGKSTLFNTLYSKYNENASEKLVEEKDMLFATLDTSVRNITLEDNKTFLLSDTVGFVSKLPHGLVKAFKSTLDEITLADVIIQVIDYSDPNYLKHIEVTNNTLKEIGANTDNLIYVFNKCDKIGNLEFDLPYINDNEIYMSVKNNIGIDELIRLIKEKLFKDYITTKMLIPYDKGNISSYLKNEGNVLSIEYLGEGELLNIELKQKDFNKYKEFNI